MFSGAVCNNAQIVGGHLLGQPTEGAILVAAIKASIFVTITCLEHCSELKDNNLMI